jgi:hypothetical protein
LTTGAGAPKERKMNQEITSKVIEIVASQLEIEPTRSSPSRRSPTT